MADYNTSTLAIRGAGRGDINVAHDREAFALKLDALRHYDCSGEVV
jgi:hypothetical protein